MALVGNLLVIWTTINELYGDRLNRRLGRQAKCNRVFVLNLAVADLLMGVNLIVHVIINEMFQNM